MNPRLELITAEIFHNEVTKLSSFVTLYTDLKGILDGLDQADPIKNKLEKILEPFAEIKEIVGDDVQTYFNQKYNVIAKKEKFYLSADEAQGAYQWRYSMESLTSNKTINFPIVLISFLANEDFFQTRAAIATIGSQMEHILAMLNAWAVTNKELAQVLSKNDLRGVIAGAVQNNVQLGQLGDQLSKIQEVSEIGRRMSMLAALFSRAMNEKTKAVSIDVGDMRVVAQQREVLQAQLKSLTQIYNESKQKLEAIKEALSSDEVKIKFQKLLDLGLIVTKFDKKMMQSSVAFSPEDMSNLRIKIESEEFWQSLSMTELKEMASAMRSLQESRYIKACELDTIEDYKEFIEGIFRIHASKQAALDEASNKTTSGIHEKKVTGLVAHMGQHLFEHKEKLDELLISIHAQFELPISPLLNRLRLNDNVLSPRGISESDSVRVRFNRANSTAARKKSDPSHVLSASAVAQVVAEKAQVALPPASQVPQTMFVANKSAVSGRNPEFAAGSRTYKDGNEGVVSASSAPTAANEMRGIGASQFAAFSKTLNAALTKNPNPNSSSSLPKKK